MPSSAVLAERTVVYFGILAVLHFVQDQLPLSSNSMRLSAFFISVLIPHAEHGNITVVCIFVIRSVLGAHHRKGAERVDVHLTVRIEGDLISASIKIVEEVDAVIFRYILCRAAGFYIVYE